MKVLLNNVGFNIIPTDKTNKDLGENNRGIIYYEDLNILLDKNLPSELLIQTLYHEICHAICEQTSFNNMLEEKLGDNGYEIFIDNMGKILYDIIHKNDMKKIEKELLKEVNNEETN